jgi:hypothetical protein
MRVTGDMTTEGGAALSTLADLLGEDEVGVQLTTAEVGDAARLAVDSTSTNAKHVYLDADDCDRLADLLRAKARELRGVR